MLPARAARLFYGWWIVSAGMIIQILIGGLMFQSFGTYAAVLRDDFGWSKTTLSAAFSMTRVESGMLGPFQGWAIDRFGPKVMIRIGITTTAVGFVLFSQINSVLTFFLTFFLIAVGSSMAGFMTLTVAVVNWFHRKRSLALGLMSTGFAVGGLIVPLVATSMETIGWRWTAFITGCVIFAVGQTMATVVRHRPEDIGETIDGVPEVEAAPASADDPAPAVVSVQRDFTAREALRTPAFWFISLGHASAVLIIGALMVHLVLHVNENLGYSLTAAALVVALQTGFQIAGQLGGGFMGDRINKRSLLVGCMVAHCSALLLLAYATALWMIVVFAVVNGLAWGARGPVQQALRADYFGRRSFGTIMGFSSLIVMSGMTAGPIIAGVLADRTGGYEAGFTVLAVMAAAGTIFFALAAPPKPPSERREAGPPERPLPTPALAPER